MNQSVRFLTQTNQTWIDKLLAILNAKVAKINLAESKSHVKRIVMLVNNKSISNLFNQVCIIGQFELTNLIEISIIFNQQCCCTRVTNINNHVNILYLNISIFVKFYFWECFFLCKIVYQECIRSNVSHTSNICSLDLRNTCNARMN